ncbi:MAG: efflux RND transporter periplasmic adaptor subunit [Bacteroidetes bacterium]|nr:efflux RND transporter periplasmic adaptor subunit [Bacteroidota bacterium]
MKASCYQYIFLVVILVMMMASCQKKQQNTGMPASVQKPMEVNGIILKPKELGNKIFTTGTILANEEVEIRSEVPGRVMAINFEEGSYVGKGAVLVKINDDELQAQMKKLILDEELAKEDVYRKGKLLEINAVSQEEYDISQNQLGVIQAQIDLVRSQLIKTVISAPFSGKIGLRYVSPGGYISSAMLIARMQETNPVKIEFAVPEKYISEIEKGTVIQFNVDGTDSTFRGEIYAIEPKIDPSTRALTVRARCSNNGNLLIPGAFAKIGIILQIITDALVLPTEALIPDIRGEKVFVAVNGQAKAVYVDTGIRTEQEIQITKGLQPGDTIITTGLLQLKEGMKVKVNQLITQ